MTLCSEALELFQDLFSQAQNLDVREPAAMTLATASPDGIPSARVVLLKQVDARGFVFYTNLKSQKGQELRDNPVASLCFYWDQMGWQVRATGKIEYVTDEEADAYFASRARRSQLGAWASQQSSDLESYDLLIQRLEDAEARFEGKEVARPPHWSGVRVIPQRVEFWEGLPNRLHKRTVFEADAGQWKKKTIYP